MCSRRSICAVLLAGLVPSFGLAPAWAAAPSVTVVNESALGIWEVQISPDYSIDWGDGLLGARTIAPGEELLIDLSDFEDHCIFDVKITSDVFGLGPEQVEYDLNLCEIERITFSPDPQSIEPRESGIIGTAFMITSGGMLLTNHHVIEDCNEIDIRGYGPARVYAQSAENDLALLSVDVEAELSLKEVAVFRSAPKVRLGEPVVVYGFPFTQVMSRYGVVADGLIASLSGHKDDIREYQLTAPVHPGNSGGPLLDLGGKVIGIVSSSLHATDAENVSYAIKWSVIRSFLEAHRVEFIMEASDTELSIPDIVENATSYTLPVSCS